MHLKEAEIITIKKLKKDGSIGREFVQRIAECVRKEGVAVLPIDNIYGLIGLAVPPVEKRISALLDKPGRKLVRLISSFKMLDDIASFTKYDYDFLNRVWPGEVTIVMKRKRSFEGNPSIAVRYPKNKFLLSVISDVGSPMVFKNVYKAQGSPMYNKSEILRAFRDSVDQVVIIEELCRSHPASTLVDISEGCLNILREGKVSAEEIKSLYFLGKDDDTAF